MIGLEYVIYSQVNKDTSRIRAIGGTGVSEFHLRRINYALDSDNITAYIVKQGERELLTGWDDRFDKEIFETEQQENWIRLFLPVTLRLENIGVVEAGFNQLIDKKISDSQINLLRAFIDQTALALDNAQRYEASQRQARREALIKDITTKVRASTDIDTILQTVVKELGQAIEGQRPYVHLVSPSPRSSER